MKSIYKFSLIPLLCICCGCSPKQSESDTSNKLLFYLRGRMEQSSQKYFMDTISDFMRENASDVDFEFRYNGVDQANLDITSVNYDSALFLNASYDHDIFRRNMLKLVDMNELVDQDVLNEIDSNLLNLYKVDNKQVCLPFTWTSDVCVYNETYFKELYGDTFDEKMRSLTHIENLLIEKNNYDYHWLSMLFNPSLQTVHSYFLENNIVIPSTKTVENVTFMTDLLKEWGPLLSGIDNINIEFTEKEYEERVVGPTKIAVTYPYWKVSAETVFQSEELFTLGVMPIILYGNRINANAQNILYARKIEKSNKVDNAVRKLLNELILNKDFMLNCASESLMLPVRKDLLSDPNLPKVYEGVSEREYTCILQNGTNNVFTGPSLLNQQIIEAFMDFATNSNEDQHNSVEMYARNLIDYVDSIIKMNN